MSGSDYLDHLAHIRLFSSCTTKELSNVAKASDEITLPQGKVLMTQGEPGRELFVIVSGSASVTIDGIQVAQLGPGDHVGELALLDGESRTATVTATSELTVLVMTQQAFFGLLDTVPGLSRKVLESLAHTIRELDKLVGNA